MISSRLYTSPTGSVRRHISLCGWSVCRLTDLYLTLECCRSDQRGQEIADIRVQPILIHYRFSLISSPRQSLIETKALRCWSISVVSVLCDCVCGHVSHLSSLPYHPWEYVLIQYTRLYRRRCTMVQCLVQLLDGTDCEVDVNVSSVLNLLTVIDWRYKKLSCRRKAARLSIRVVENLAADRDRSMSFTVDRVSRV